MGLLHGVLQCLTRIFKRPYEKLLNVTRWMLTFFFINLLLVIFRSDSLGDAREFILRMFISPDFNVSAELANCFRLVEFAPLRERIPETVLYFLSNYPMWLFLSLSLFAILNVKNSSELAFKPGFVYSALAVIMLFWSIISLSGVSEFLYFNF